MLLVHSVEHIDQHLGGKPAYRELPHSSDQSHAMVATTCATVVQSMNDILQIFSQLLLTYHSKCT